MREWVETPTGQKDNEASGEISSKSGNVKLEQVFKYIIEGRIKFVVIDNKKYRVKMEEM